MLVVNRFDVPESTAEQFRSDARAALQVLSKCRGFVRGSCGASLDEPRSWVMSTEWESVGAYRRALSSYDVKMHATPVMARATPEPSAFEMNLRAEPGNVSEQETDRAQTSNPDREAAS